MLSTYVYVPSRVNETHFQAKSLNEDWNCLIGVCAGGRFAIPGLLQDYSCKRTGYEKTGSSFCYRENQHAKLPLGCM